MSAWIIRIKQDWIRVPLWSLWFPVTLARYMVSAILHGSGARLLQAECWSNMMAFYIIGLDGWGQYE